MGCLILCGVLRENNHIHRTVAEQTGTLLAIDSFAQSSLENCKFSKTVALIFCAL